MTTKRPHPEDEAQADEAPPVATPLPADDEPGLSEDDYWEQRRALEAKLLQLAARRVASPRFPRWLYHATERPRIVATRGERQALGSGWQVTPV